MEINLGFLLLNNPKDLDPSYRTTLAILEWFGMDLGF